MRLASLIFLSFLVFCAPAQAREEKAPDFQPSVSVKNYSRLAGDPGEITEKNAPLYKTSDGSPVADVVYEGQKSARGYQNVYYSRSGLTDETKKISQDAVNFFADEQKRRNDLIAGIRAGKISQDQAAAARKDENQRRQDFARSQQAKIDEINCRGINTPACDAVRDRNKKSFFFF